MTGNESTYSRLISGSDLRGVAVESPGRPVTLTCDAAGAAAQWFAGFVSRKRGRPTDALRIAVAHDGRVSADRLHDAVIGGLAAQGVFILDCGLATTPSMFAVCTRAETAADGAIMITASHLPWMMNGLKFITREGGLSHGDIAEMVRGMAELPARADSPTADQVAARTLKVAFLKIYAETMRAMIRAGTRAARPLEGMRIVVDAGNGAGGFFAEEVLVPLGADIGGSIGLKPDGRFPIHVPNPEDPVAMAALCGAVTEARADLGLIFDADVDRVGLCDVSGASLGRNRLVALCAALLLSQRPGAAIVTDSVTSSGLTRFIEAHGGRHIRYKRGYRNVIEEAQRLCALGQDAPLAIETSGHAAFADNAFLDDGAYLASWLLIHEVRLRGEGRTLTDLLAGWQEPAEACEVRVQFEDMSDADAVIDALKAYRHGIAAPDNHDGYRLLLPVSGMPGAAWLQARRSVHDPVLVMNAESEAPGGLIAAREALSTALKACPALRERVLGAWDALGSAQTRTRDTAP